LHFIDKFSFDYQRRVKADILALRFRAIAVAPQQNNLYYENPDQLYQRNPQSPNEEEGLVRGRD
jgi:hypothetical protein